MLRKLLKYELRSNIKIFLFVWPAIVIFALIERLAISADLRGSAATILVGTTTTVFVLAVAAACIFSLIISIIRFYSGLLRDEGYLMFTLPVRPWQLILSKFITAVLTIAVTLLLSVLSVIFLFAGVDGFFDGVRFLWRYLDLPTGITLTLLLLLAFTSICVSVLQIYLACSVGHLFRKYRVLWSFLVYYGINVLIEIVSVSSLVSINSYGNVIFSSQGNINLFLGVLLFIQVALGALYFLLSEHILRTRLNLE